MASHRQRGRQLALQALYAADIAGHKPEASLESLLTEERPVAGAADAARQLLQGLVAKWDRVNGLVEAAAPLWPLPQVAAIDRNILRLAAYELVLEDARKAPDAVIINEAVDLAKRFGSESSARFVNGVLGTLTRSAEAAGARAGVATSQS